VVKLDFFVVDISILKISANYMKFFNVNQFEIGVLKEFGIYFFKNM